MKLTKISFLGALVGIWFLILLANVLPTPHYTVSEINESDLNKQITLTGNITSVKTFPDSTFQLLTLEDSSGKITLTLDSKEEFNKTDNVLVFGTVSEYNGTLQISTDKIISLDLVNQ